MNRAGMFHDGTKIRVYAIKEKVGQYRDHSRDKTIYITFTKDKKNLRTVLDHYRNDVAESDSINHQAVFDYLNSKPKKKYYVKFFGNDEYEADVTRNKILRLQNIHDSIIKYE